MKIKKIAQEMGIDERGEEGSSIPKLSYCFDIASEIKPVFDEIVDIRYAIDGVRAVYKYKDGRKYEILIKPLKE